MTTKEKSLGTQFLEEFIDLREKDPDEVTLRVLLFFQKHNIHYQSTEASPQQLVSQFFNESPARIVRVFASDSSIHPETLLIGKGVCYDTGGYSLKNTMKGMHYDKNGALLAIASAIDHNVDAVVFFVSNMIHDRAPVEDDILTEPNTKLRVLIDDTDAEGRIGLASLIAEYGRDYANVITLATITGSAVNVTGDRTFALAHTNFAKTDYPKILKAALKGTKHPAKMWPAPFHKDYDKAIDTKVKGADVRSCGSFKGAGSSTAFSFLKRFREPGKRLMHLDIAAMMLDADGNGLVFGLKEVGELIKIAEG